MQLNSLSVIKIGFKHFFAPTTVDIKFKLKISFISQLDS